AQPTLEGRALLPADAAAPAPFPGAPNTDPAPVPDGRQPVGGFSALVEAPGKDAFWAMPDNGFGSKANSRSFLLRVYRVRVDFERKAGDGSGVEILDSITLSDPDRRVPFPIVNEGSAERLLTGGDFDPESFRVDPRGDLWFGEEFGPFLLHTDRTGKLLEAPIALPGVQSPDNPFLGAGTANLGRSNGFEGMAISTDGRRLYPVLEGPVTGDDPTVRRVAEFDLERSRYTGRRWDYRVADASFLVSDFTALSKERFVALERDNFEGVAAQHKKAFVTTIDRPGGVLPKRQVLDLLDIADPTRISEPANEGDVGIGDPFAMPYVTIEAVLPTRGNRLAIVNDTNFGSRGRNPSAPDPSDFIEVSVPDLRDARDDDEGRRGGGRRSRATTLSVIGDTPYGDEQVKQFPLLVADVNRQRDVRGVVHLGDVKSGSSTCTDERFRSVRRLFNTFDAPFVLTPGDNDWTDCHRANNGAFVPTERLAKFRRVFYPRVGRTLGGWPMKVETQGFDRRFGRYVENQRWERGGAVIATVHVVGSQNGLLPWFGAAETAEQRNTRLAEVAEREEANLAWIDAAFNRARRSGARGVVLAMQADTFAAAGPAGFERVLERIASRAATFDGPVLLLQGDTHKYKTDQPLANVTRIVVEGETAAEWLRLRIDDDLPGLFSWTREAVPGLG
ncbi:MAG: esterase-like activity of phytase family protein, partial [Actinomycetota bacterium]|nr:esterase-like activity of phytase family protein [Actinomycetota bacterium]